MAEARATWSGSLTFGLVNIPVKQYAGHDEKADKIRFTTVHKTCKKPIKHSLSAGAKARCTHCACAVDKTDAVKAYELEDGTYLPINEDELDNVALAGNHNLEVTKFVPLDSIDPAYFDLFNLLAPADGPVRGYIAVGQALYEQHVGAIARQIKGGHDYVWLIRAIKTEQPVVTTQKKKNTTTPVYVLAMTSLRRPSEVRTSLVEKIGSDLLTRADGGWPIAAEISMAKQLIEAGLGTFDPAEYPDRRQEALQKIVDAVLKGKKLVPAKAKAEPEVAGDLLAALRASVAGAKKNKKSLKAAAK